MLYTNQGGLSTPGIKTENLTLSERLAAALEKRSQSRSATYNGLLDDESDDIFMSSSSSSDTSSDSDDEDSDDVTVTSGAMANKGENDINKVFEDIDEKTRVMFEVTSCCTSLAHKGGHRCNFSHNYLHNLYQHAPGCRSPEIYTMLQIKMEFKSLFANKTTFLSFQKKKSQKIQIK